MRPSQFGRGDERLPDRNDRNRQKTIDRMDDVNQSTRPNEVKMADLKKGRR